MSAKNAFGYYLLKRAQAHLMQEGAWDAALNTLNIAKDAVLNGKDLTHEEQKLVIAICNYQRWEDVPDEQPIGQCIAGGAQ